MADSAAYAKVRRDFLKLRYEEDPTVLIDELVNLANEVARAKLKRRVFPPNGSGPGRSRSPFTDSTPPAALPNG
jgi:processive 1,2-diacylglycerol beta-glucosyltransferase